MTEISNLSKRTFKAFAWEGCGVFAFQKSTLTAVLKMKLFFHFKKKQHCNKAFSFLYASSGYEKLKSLCS